MVYINKINLINYGNGGMYIYFYLFIQLKNLFNYYLVLIFIFILLIFTFPKFWNGMAFNLLQ
jgi:hypothetical protein